MTTIISPLPFPDFVAGTTIVSSQVDADFAAIVTDVNANAVAKADLAFAGAALVKSADQSLTSNTPVAVIWDSTDEDTDGFWSNGQPTRLTVPVTVDAGTPSRVTVTGQGVFANTTSGGIRSVNIKKNGGTFYGQGHLELDLSTEDFPQILPCASFDLPVVPGDYFELWVNQTTGGPLNLTGTDETWFKIKITETS